MKSRKRKKRDEFRKLARQLIRDTRQLKVDASWSSFVDVLRDTTELDYVARSSERNLFRVLESIFSPFGSYLDANTLVRKGHTEALKEAQRRLESEAVKSERKRIAAIDFERKRIRALSAQNDATLAVLPIMLALLTDVGAPHADHVYFRTRCENEGWAFLSKILPKLEKALIDGLSTGQFKSIEDFACHPKTMLPRWLYCLFSEVFFDDGKLKQIDDASPIAVQMLRQILGFSYKANVPYDVELELDAVQRFVLTEEELVEINQNLFETSSSDPILKVCSLLCYNVFSPYERDTSVRENIRFRHGPGVTSDVPKTEKFEQGLPPIPSVVHFFPHHFFNENDMKDRAWREAPRGHWDYFYSSNAAKLLLVPKDARGPRIISCEPSANQWIQQGIRAFMYDSMESHPLTGGRVNFTDQSVNMEKAREASMSGEWSTLDLKDASDRVSLGLVRAIFSSCPALLQDLLRVRSDFTVLPDGRKISLEKYAPMGSALCFPVLAFACWSIIVSGLIGLGYDIRTSSQCVYVYGDDIIVPTGVAEYAMSLLERYGLLVNKSKSFVGSRFAESCGGDYFDGNEVNLVRLRECPLAGKTGRARRMVSVLETANELNRLGYESAATYLYSFVERYSGSLPYGYPHSRFLNRTYLGFMGKDAWSVTISKKPYSGSILKWTTEQHQPGAIPSLVVRTVTKGKERSNWVSFGGHSLRINPTLGTGDVPIAGVFDDSSGDLIMKVIHVDENDFSPYEANKYRFIPGEPI